MATLKEKIDAARTGKLSKEGAEKLKQLILSGKVDAMAQSEGVDLEPFKNQHGKKTTTTPDFLKRGMALTEEQTTDPATKATAQNLQVGMTGDLNPATKPPLSPEDQARSDARAGLLDYSPTGALVDTAKTFGEGVKSVGEGLLTTGKEMVGKDENKEVSGEGWSQAINGAFQAMSAPIHGVLKNVPGGDLVESALGEVFTAPASLLGAAWETAWKAAGKDVNDPAFEMGKQQIMDAVNVGTALATPKITGAVKNMVTPGVGKSALPEITKLAEQKGVELPLSAQTKSEFVRSTEALQKNGLFGGDLVIKSETAAAKIAELTDQTVKQLDSTDLGKLDVGNMMKEGFQQVKDTFKSTKNDLYDAAQTQLDNANVKTKFISPTEAAATNAALDELISSSKKSLVPGEGLSFFEQLKGGLNTNKLTLDTLRQTLKSVGEKMKNNNDPIATGNRAALSKIYASLSQDLDTIYSTKVPAFKDAISTANTYYKNNIELINGKFGSMVDSATPEQIYQKFVKPNSPTPLIDLKQLVGEDTFASVSGVFLKDLLEKSTKNDQFSIDIFSKELAKWDTPTLEALLNKDQLARLEEVKTQLGSLKTLGDALKAGEAKSKGSQTGFLNVVAKMKNAVSTGGIGLAGFLQGVPGLIGAALLYILSDYSLSKLLTSKLGQELFTTGPKAMSIDFLKAHADQIGTLVQQSISSGGSQNSAKE